MKRVLNGSRSGFAAADVKYKFHFMAQMMHLLQVDDLS